MPDEKKKFDPDQFFIPRSEREDDLLDRIDDWITESMKKVNLYPESEED